MSGKRVILLAVSPLIAWGQKPVITAVVNAASYQPVSGAWSGDILTILGKNLASATATANTIALPKQLAGTTVTVNTRVPNDAALYPAAAPLFYVSPNQINLQVPLPPNFPCLGCNATQISTQGITVSTTAGTSDPYAPGVGDGLNLGVFTGDSSGCGQGAVLNVASDGSLSVNSAANSVSPGDYIAVFGTELGSVYNPPADGVPAPPSPLARVAGGGNIYVDFSRVLIENVNLFYAGRAPGLIGVDQVNGRVPTTTREGCAVPLQVEGDLWLSQPVTISIHKGGGPCVDPPSASYGRIVWEKSVTYPPPPGAPAEADTLTVSLQSSPGQKPPPAPAIGSLAGVTLYGASCPIAGYHSLDAGPVAAQGPGLAGVTAPSLPAQQADSGWSLDGAPIAASGLKTNHATLSTGSIQPGSFTVSASGGGDVGPFQSTVPIGTEIQITTPLAGKTFPGKGPLIVAWTGGDPNSLVTVRFVSAPASRLLYGADAYSAFTVPAPAGSVALPLVDEPPYGLLLSMSGPIEIVVEVTPAQPQTFSAPGLSLGGEHTWKHTYRFQGVLIQ